MEGVPASANDGGDKTPREQPIQVKAAPYFDINITAEIHDAEKGTKKMKEMQQIIKMLQAEAKSLNAENFGMKQIARKQITQLVEVFAETGGTLVQMYPGSVVFVVRYFCKEDLQKLLKMYRNQSLQNTLKATLINEHLGKRVFKKLGINVTLDEKAYKRGMKFFSKEEKKTVPTPSLSSEEPVIKPAPMLFLTQYLTTARQSVVKADDEIKQLKEEIRERCENLCKVSAAREEIMSSMKWNLDKVAAKISFGVSVSDSSKPDKHPVKRKPDARTVDKDKTQTAHDKTEALDKGASDTAPPVKKKAKVPKVELDLVAETRKIFRKSQQELLPPSTFLSVTQPKVTGLESSTPINQKGKVKVGTDSGRGNDVTNYQRRFSPEIFKLSDMQNQSSELSSRDCQQFSSSSCYQSILDKSSWHTL